MNLSRRSVRSRKTTLRGTYHCVILFLCWFVHAFSVVRVHSFFAGLVAQLVSGAWCPSQRANVMRLWGAWASQQLMLHHRNCSRWKECSGNSLAHRAEPHTVQAVAGIFLIPPPVGGVAVWQPLLSLHSIRSALAGPKIALLVVMVALSLDRDLLRLP